MYEIVLTLTTFESGGETSHTTTYSDNNSSDEYWCQTDMVQECLFFTKQMLEKKQHPMVDCHFHFTAGQKKTARDTKKTEGFNRLRDFANKADSGTASRTA